MAAMTGRQTYPAYTPAPVDLEKGVFDGDASDFADRHLRLGFIRKVFGILSAQLLLTAAIAAPVVLSSGVKQSLMAHPGVMALALMVSLGCLLVLSFSESARHSHPTNLILLAVFTAAEGLMVGAVCAQYNMVSVALAVMITACVTGGLAVYALTTKKDFTMQNGLLLTLLFTLIGAGLVNAFVRSSAMELALAAGGALLFGAYIVVDVQMLAGGKHTEQRISPDEYVLGAITIYLDIINLFLHILRIIGDRQ